MNAVCRAVALVLVLVCGCAPRGAIIVDPAAAKVGDVETLYVASSRQPGGISIDYQRGAAPALSFSRTEVSVPPVRELGTVSFTVGTAPDPTTDFLTVSSERIADSKAFVRAINAAVGAQPKGQREAFLFVHGFNTNFAEGLYRQAQMRHDFGAPGISIHYAWPSAARARSYATDREAVLQARDDLEQLIAILSRSGVTRIVVAGHSMGAMLVMEAMRQMAIRNAPGSFAKISTVVLMAPDIDVGVFRRQAAAVSAKDVSIYVFTSNRDRALRLSAALRGTGPRLGSLTDDRALGELPVTIIDLSDVNGNGDALNHFKVATSPVMISLLRGFSQYGERVFADADRDHGLVDTGLGIVQGVTSIALAPITDR
jgi:esterase/lipase superfamily enzyme